MLLFMLDCMEVQGVAQNRTIPPIQTVCLLSIVFDDSGPDRNLIYTSFLVLFVCVADVLVC